MKQKIIIIAVTTVIILTAYFLTIPVKASEASNELKNIVLLLGTKECDLEIEGYTILNNELNINQLGYYEVVYQCNDTKELFIRKVWVIDQNGYYNETMTSIETFNDYPMELLSTKSYGHNKHLLIIKFITNTKDNSGYIFMYTLENDQIIKSVNLYFNVDLVVNDLEIIDNHFIMTGKIWNSLYGNYDMFIRINSLDGLLILDKTYGGSNEDIGYQIAETDKAYLVFGKTFSNDKTFNTNSSKEANYLMAIDKVNKEIINISYNLDDVDLNHACFIKNDGNIVLGYDVSSKTSKIFELDDIGNILDVIEIEKAKDETLIEIIMGEKIKLLYSKQNYLVIRTFNEEKEEIDLKGEIKQILVNGSKISFLLNQDGHYIYKVLETTKTFDNVVYELTLDNSKYYLVEDGVILKEDRSINVYNISYLYINSLGNSVIDVKNQEYHDYDIVMNGKNIKHNYKTIDNVNKDNLGKYLVKYVFDEEFIFLMDKEIIVYENVGVSDGGVYDVGTTINTHSQAYLNGELLQGEYIFKDVGEYTLELIGKGFNQTINFEVRDLRISPGVEVAEEVELTYEISSPILTTEEVDINVNTSSKDIDIVHNNWNWVYTVPALLSVVVAFIIVKIKF